MPLLCILIFSALSAIVLESWIILTFCQRFQVTGFFSPLWCRRVKIACTCCSDVHPKFQALKKLTSFNFIDFPDRNILNVSHFSIFLTWFFTWLFHGFTSFFASSQLRGGGGGVAPHTPTCYVRAEKPTLFTNRGTQLNTILLQFINSTTLTCTVK